MTSRSIAARVAVGMATLALLSAIACQNIAGLGDFQPEGGSPSTSTSGQGGDGGDGGDTSSPASSGGHDGAGGEGAGEAGGAGTGAATGSSSSTVSSTSTTSTGGGCTLDHLVISEVRTRGPGDGNQDFVEILNPTASSITLTSAFRVDARGEASGTYGTRWTGDGSIVLASGAHALLANDAGDNPLGAATADAFYQSGIPDGSSVVLYEGEVVLDAVCFTCEEATLSADYVCEGAPLARGAACAEPGDASVQRKPASGVEGCADTDDNAADLGEGPSTPQGTGS